MEPYSVHSNGSSERYVPPDSVKRKQAEDWVNVGDTMTQFSYPV